MLGCCSNAYSRRLSMTSQCGNASELRSCLNNADTEWRPNANHALT